MNKHHLTQRSLRPRHANLTLAGAPAPTVLGGTAGSRRPTRSRRAANWFQGRSRITNKVSKQFALALTLAVLATSAARAELIYGITNNGASAPSLVSFDSASPGASTIIGSTGVADLRAIDFRPANGLLYGLGFDTASRAAQLYTIDLTTGAAIPLFAPTTLTGASASSRVSLDFNPVSDRLRVVTANGSSFRLDPNTGVLTADTAFAYAAGDRNEGENPPLIAGVAYTNNVAGATSTTLFAFDFNLDVISRVGSVGGSPISPNTGRMFTIGDLGGPTAVGGDVGFDISGRTGIAYLNLDDISSPTAADEFYTVNLSSGMATLVGTTTGLDLLDITAAPIPEPGTVALTAVGVIGLVAAVRRRRGQAAR